MMPSYMSANHANTYKDQIKFNRHLHSVQFVVLVHHDQICLHFALVFMH